MGALALGPFAIPHSLLAALGGFLVFTLLVSSAKRRFPALDVWSSIVLLSGAITARAVHVMLNWQSFADDPLRILMFWQGGFDWRVGLVAAVLTSAYILKTWTQRSVGIAIVFATFFVWGISDHFLSSTREGVTIPDVVLSDSRKDVELKQFAKGPLVVNVWATWCPPCRRELPALLSAAERNQDVRFLLVNQAESPETVRQFMQREGLTDQYVLYDANSSLSKALRLVGVPVTLFFMDGSLRELHAGEITPEALAAKIKALR